MLRSWKKSLVRLGILIVDVLIALFTAPAIASAIIKKIAHGTTISIFNFNIDFSKIIEGFVGDSLTGDIAAAQEITNELATALINVVVNLVLFFLMFIVLWLISLIIYGIVFAIIKHTGKKEGKEKKHENIGLRFVGGLIGAVSMCVICFALLVPVFGAMNVCNKFLDENSEDKAKAQVISPYLGGKLYYTENETIGQVETYIEKYSEYKEKYDKSIAGAFFNFTGISKLGGYSFSYLTNVSSGSLKLNVTDELVSIISTYNEYKKTFIENEFNIENNDSVDGLISIYDQATKSAIVNGYMVELLPTMAEKWSNGETFLGVKNPVGEEYAPVVNQLLKIFTVKNSNRINANIKVIFDVIKVANNNELLPVFRENRDLVEYLNGNTTLFKDLILTLSSTEELRNNLPVVLNELIKILYNSMVGGENPIEDLTTEQIQNIDWNFEAQNMQNIINELISLDKKISNEEGKMNYADVLGSTGKIIDLSRRAALESSLKSFIVGFINSDNLDFGEKTAEVKAELIKHINERWNYEENKTFSYETTFRAIGETAQIVSNIADKAANVTMDDFADVLEVIASNPESKEVIKDIIAGDVVNNLVGTNETSAAIKDVMVEFIDNANTDTIEKDVAAGQKIIDIVNASSNDKTIGLEGNEANEVVEALTGSSTAIGILDKAASGESENVAKIIGDLDSNSKAAIAQSFENAEINENLSAEQKERIINLFKK